MVELEEGQELVELLGVRLKVPKQRHVRRWPANRRQPHIIRITHIDQGSGLLIRHGYAVAPR